MNLAHATLALAVLAGALGMILMERRRPRPSRLWITLWLVFSGAAVGVLLYDLVLAPLLGRT